MCGITGYINLNNQSVRDTGLIMKMLLIQKHRGPDDSGIRVFSLRTGLSQECDVTKPDGVNGNFEGVLGFNRLSILDLSLNGHQPMVSPDGKVLLALNGEIYNAFDFKDELQSWGYKFKSSTDTEIVLALYLRYGFEGTLERLNGMFAIVIVDLGHHELLIARDRFGIKPMYYIYTNKILAFSSELKSFRYINNFYFRLNEGQLDEYLLFRNQLNGTLIHGVNSLNPGHYLKFTHEDGLAKKMYFNINDYTRSIDSAKGIRIYEKRLEEWLSRSVNNQLMSDVKLGCQLSGGIDSSLVTWLANRNNDLGNFEAVSVIFRNQRFSEAKYINMVAETMAIVSHRFCLDPEYYLGNIEKATWHFEAPLSHPNTIAIYKLSEQAKKYVTVLLSGEGADEVFGGYGRFHDVVSPFHGKKILNELRKSLQYPFGIVRYLDPEYRAVMATAFITPGMAKKIMGSFNIEVALADRISLYRKLAGSAFDRQVKYELSTYLPDLLIRQDKMSMAHSIENRVPFLDNEVVENSFTIPEKLLLLRKGPEGYCTGKYLLKMIVASSFGKEFAFREKMGFGIPVKEFLLNDRFIEYLNSKVLPAIKKRDLFNFNLVSSWFSDIKNLKYYELEALWIVITFEIWASLYLDNHHENSDSRT